MIERVVQLDAVREERAAFEGLRVLACCVSEHARKALAAIFDDLDGAHCILAAAGDEAHAAFAAMASPPHAFFFEARNEDEAVATIRKLRPVADSLHIVALLPSMTRSGALALIRAGADDVMSAAPDANDVIRALAKASARATDDVKTGEEGGETVKTLAFLHASGGAGATTLAVNGALLLAERVKKENGRVALIDLDAQFGDADLHMDLRERSRLLEILKAPERLDHRMLEDLMVDGPKGIRVLTVGEAPLPLDAFSPQTIETILAIARKQYRYVVVDMPLALTQWTDAALQRVDHAFIVTQASVPALNSARRLIQALKDENALAAPATVLLNRYGGKGQSPKITLEQAAKSLDQPIRFTLPSDYSLLSDSIDQGVPAALQRSASKFCESLGAALDSVVEHKGVAAATSPVRKVFKFGR